MLQILRLYVLGVLHIALRPDGVRRPRLCRRHVCRELAQLAGKRVEHLLLRVQFRLEPHLRLVQLLLVHDVFRLLFRVASLNFDVFLLNASKRLFELVCVLLVRRQLQIRFLKQLSLIFDSVLGFFVLRERFCHNLLYLDVSL